MRTWDNIYADNSRKLKGVCRRYVKSDEIAEDIMHDAFEIAIKKADSYTGKGSFEGWLYQITINTALQYLRKNKKTTSKTDDLLEYHHEIESEQPKNNIVYQANFEVSDLVEAIDLLPEHHRTVFNLYVFEKYSHHQISEELKISTNTSKSHLNRARKKLQCILIEKAKNKEKDDFKKYLLLLLPFYFSIDKMYARQLKGYSLPVKISRQELNKIKVKKSFSYPKFKVLGAVLFFVLLLGFIYKIENTTTLSKYNPINIQQIQKGEYLQIDDFIIEIDSLFTKIEEISKNAKKVPEKGKVNDKDYIIKVPVVVHKKVIINDTVFVK